MIQEYLFFDDTHREAVEKYAPAKVTVDIFDIENSTCWIVTYSAPHENEDTAKLLSQVNEHVVGNFCPTVLTNESSAYFNKKLYPYINEFERKLRKLLYLKSAIYHGSKKIDNIRDLEAKDLGTIFELLFTDAEFITTAKKKVNAKTWQYTKKEIIAALQSISEDTVWDSLLGAESVTSLSNNFLTVKNYRNDVMHAHNIDAKTFRDAKKLFADINKQLDVEIGLIIRKAEEEPEETVGSDFNDALNTALSAQNMSDAIKQARDSIMELTGGQPEAIREAIRYMQEYYSSINYPELQDLMKPILDFYSGTEYAQLQETLRLIAAYQKAPDFDMLQKQLRETAAFSEAIMNSMGLVLPKKQEEEILPETCDSENDAGAAETEEKDNA